MTGKYGFERKQQLPVSTHNLDIHYQKSQDAENVEMRATCCLLNQVYSVTDRKLHSFNKYLYGVIQLKCYIIGLKFLFSFINPVV